MDLRQVSDRIMKEAIAAAQPDEAVRRALAGRRFPGRVFLVAVGKAAWRMAEAALPLAPVTDGVVITKRGGSFGALPGLRVFEAGHPVPDEDGFRATGEALRLVRGLRADDTVLLLVSGGGSALFEQPLLPPEELADITAQLLRSGADIAEMNAVRKRLSAVKGGRFAALCAPARVTAVLLSDVLGDRPDVIASGPACPDASTCADALAAAEKYRLRLSDRARALLNEETPKALPNAENLVGGGVRQLVASARETCAALGFPTEVLTEGLCCEARDAGAQFAALARQHAGQGPRAFLAGGETVVHVTGTGLGGRNQELALAAAIGMEGVENALLLSFGSDGTDGPTDAAGAAVDGGSTARMRAAGVCPQAALANNDAYHALKASGDLIFTGATGTNVNDLAALLIGG